MTRRTGIVPDDSASSRRRLQKMVHQLQGDLDWIVMKCLEKDCQRVATGNGDHTAKVWEAATGR